MNSEMYSNSKIKNVWNMFCLDLKKDGIILVLTTLLAALLSPGVMAAKYCLGPKSSLSDYAEETTMYTIVFVLGLFLTFFAFVDLNYLQNKSRADAVERLPISRREMLFEKMLLALIRGVLPVVCSGVLSVVFLGGPSGAELSIIGFYSVRVAILFVNVAVIAFACVCCGRVKDSVILYIIVAVTMDALALAAECLPGEILPGVHPYSQDWFGYSSAPHIYSIIETEKMWEVTLVGLIIAVVFSAIALIAVKFRKTETAQDRVAFGELYVIVKVLCAFSFGILSGLYCVTAKRNRMDFSEQWLRYGLGALIAIILVFVLINISVNKNLRGMKKELPALAISFVLVATVTLVVQTGLFSEKTDIPKKDDIEYVEVQEINNSSLIPRIPSGDAYTPEVIQEVMDMESAFVEQLEGAKKFGLYSIGGNNKGVESELPADVVIIYHLKDKSVIQKQYTSVATAKVMKPDFYWQAAGSMTVHVDSLTYIEVLIASDENGDYFRKCTDEITEEDKEWIEGFLDVYNKEAQESDVNPQESTDESDYVLDFESDEHVKVTRRVTKEMKESYAMAKEYFSRRNLTDYKEYIRKQGM